MQGLRIRRRLQEQYADAYGATYPDDPSFGDKAGQPIDYTPVLAVTYWGFRLMIGMSMVSAAVAAYALWSTRKGRVPTSRIGVYGSLLAVGAPFVGNAAGWIFTEMGRQPWVVAPNPTGPADVRLLTAQGVSRVDAWEVAISLIALTAVYGVLAAVWFGLIRRAVRHGAPSAQEVAELVTASAPLPRGAGRPPGRAFRSAHLGS